MDGEDRPPSLLSPQQQQDLKALFLFYDNDARRVLDSLFDTLVGGHFDPKVCTDPDASILHGVW